MRTIAVRANVTGSTAYGYGLSALSAVDNLEKTIGRRPTYEEVELTPIVFDPPTNSILFEVIGHDRHPCNDCNG